MYVFVSAIFSFTSCSVGLTLIDFGKEFTQQIVDLLFARLPRGNTFRLERRCPVVHALLDDLAVAVSLVSGAS